MAAIPPDYQNMIDNALNIPPAARQPRDLSIAAIRLRLPALPPGLPPALAPGYLPVVQPNAILMPPPAPLAPPPPPPPVENQPVPPPPPPPPPPEDQPVPPPLPPPPPPPPVDDAEPIPADPPPAPEEIEVQLPPPSIGEVTTISPRNFDRAILWLGQDILPASAARVPDNAMPYSRLAFNKASRQFTLISSNSHIHTTEAVPRNSPNDAVVFLSPTDTSTLLTQQFKNQAPEIIERCSSDNIQRAIRKTHQIFLAAKITGNASVPPHFIDKMFLDTRSMWQDFVTHDKIRMSDQYCLALLDEALANHQPRLNLTVDDMCTCIERLSKESAPKMQFVEAIGKRIILCPAAKEVTFSDQQTSIRNVIHIISNQLPEYINEIVSLMTSVDLTLSVFTKIKKAESGLFNSSPRIKTLQHQVQHLTDLKNTLFKRYKQARVAPVQAEPRPMPLPAQAGPVVVPNSNKQRALEQAIQNHRTALNFQTSQLEVYRIVRSGERGDARVKFDKNVHETKKIIEQIEKELKAKKAELQAIVGYENDGGEGSS